MEIQHNIMQGLESLNQFKDFVSSLGGLGRFEDTYMVHAAEGETVVPMEVLDRNPVLKKRLFKTMVDMGIEPGRYIVGNELNSINPVTGQPEFFLKKIVKGIRKAIPGDLENYLGTIVGLATGNPYLGAIAGGIGGGVGGALGGAGAGFTSPGLTTFGGKASGIMELLRGAPKIIRGVDAPPIAATKGIFGTGGEFGLTKGTLAESLGLDKIFGEKSKSFINEDVFNKLIDLGISKDKAAELALDIGNKSGPGGLGITDLLKLGIPLTTALGFLIKSGQDDSPDAEPFTPRRVDTQIFPTSDVLFPQGGMAKGGGVTDLRQGGMSLGPGTETSDDIPAMLSDGEFVMTAKAVRGAGGGDRREGAKRMYEMMDRLEGAA